MEETAFLYTNVTGEAQPEEIKPTNVATTLMSSASLNLNLPTVKVKEANVNQRPTVLVDTDIQVSSEFIFNNV